MADTDVSSLLAQLSNVQADRERMAKELERLGGELSSLKESKREEMRKVFDTVIQNWLNASVHDENVKKQFTEGMHRIIEKTQDNGVWTVAVEASQLHAKHIQEIEELRAQCEQLKNTAVNSNFKDENSRKRMREPEEPRTNTFWTGFELDPI